jgi:hypothetical protein
MKYVEERIGQNRPTHSYDPVAASQALPEVGIDPTWKPQKVAKEDEATAELESGAIHARNVVESVREEDEEMTRNVC